MVSWQPPPLIDQNGPLTSYLILYSRVGSNISMTETVSNGTEYVISGLIAFSNYSVEVVARTVNGTGPNSNSVIQISGQDGKYMKLLVSRILNWYNAKCSVWIVCVN